MILEIAGGEVASNLYDIKSQDFKPWKLKLRKDRLNKILGIEIPMKKVTGILESLNLSPRHLPGEQRRHLEDEHSEGIECIIPTYRNDLRIEEDLIEEVARIYGYNNFPKTMPEGIIPTQQIPYFKNYKLDEKVKNNLKSCGFSEIYTYSLISEKDLTEAGINSQNTLRVDNPVSRDFEYLRPTLKINLLKALVQNKPNSDKIDLFELGKVHLGQNLDESKETYFLSAISNSKSFFELKGVLERIFGDLGIKDDPTKYIEILDDGVFFELNYSEIIKKINFYKTFKQPPKYPPIIEDLSIVADNNIKTIDLISEIKSQSNLVVNVSLLDQFEDSRTFHIIYQDKNNNLTGEEVAKI